MDIRNRRAVKDLAAKSLSSAPGSPQNTVLFFVGISSAISLLTTTISYLLSGQMAHTGGLGNIGIRSILTTLQSLLPIIQSIVGLCLGFGYASAVLKMSRQEFTSPRTLLDGFVRFWPLLRIALLQALLYSGISFAALYLSMQIFLLTPLARPLLELLTSMMEAAPTILSTGAAVDPELVNAMTRAMLPMIPIFLIIGLLFAAPFYYQYRLAEFVLLDAPEKGALSALRTSRKLMKGNRIILFKLDLTFWWFFLIQILITAVSYADVLLPKIGISLPFSGAAAFFLPFLISIVLQIVVSWLFLNRIHVTYATFYNQLRRPPEVNTVPLGNIFQL